MRNSGPAIRSCLALAAIACLAGGCRSRPVGDQARYVFVYLKTGPESASHTPEQNKQIFAGHMANMHRLADAGKLIIAGPFDKPYDPSWRGIFIFDVPSVREADELVASDPGVQARVFEPELHPITGPATLRQLNDLERRMMQRQKLDSQPADPSKPPPNIRGYVMVTAEDAATARSAIERSSLAKGVVWSVRFRDSRRGVFILNATNADDVRAALNDARLEDCSIDAWWSTTALLDLPRSAGQP